MKKKDREFLLSIEKELKLKRFAEEFRVPYPEIKDIELIYIYEPYVAFGGELYIVYKKDGKLYEVDAGHCSCYGFEGQWKAEETSYEAITFRDKESKKYKGFLTAWELHLKSPGEWYECGDEDDVD